MFKQGIAVYLSKRNIALTTIYRVSKIENPAVLKICFESGPAFLGMTMLVFLPIAQFCQNYRYVDEITKNHGCAETWVNLPIAQLWDLYRYHVHIPVFLVALKALAYRRDHWSALLLFGHTLDQLDTLTQPSLRSFGCLRSLALLLSTPLQSQ